MVCRIIVLLRDRCFCIVHLVCRAVSDQRVPSTNTVQLQHAAFDHFEQTGAAVHPALSKSSMKFCGSPRKRRSGKKAATSDSPNFRQPQTQSLPFWFPAETTEFF
jgi:hypothetical protein